MLQKSELLNTIHNNIISNGYHITVVTGGELPRFAYTIGCKNSLNVEFIFAGGENFSYKEVIEIIDKIVSFSEAASCLPNDSISLDDTGSFTIARVDKSWSSLMLLGAFAYYKQDSIEVWQILPDIIHRTLDVPDMIQAYKAVSQPVWKWLSIDWDYPVPNNSMAITDLSVLFGEKATEVMRWENDEWEIFSEAGDDISKEYKRIVPLGVLVGIDSTLEPAVYIEVDKGIWRNKAELVWNNWG